MTVTREPADRAASDADPETVDHPELVDDAELAALEAAAEQARGDARRAAQAVRLARRARGRSGAAAPEARASESADAADHTGEPADDDEVTTAPPRVTLAKGATAAVVVDAPGPRTVEDDAEAEAVDETGEVVDDADTDDEPADEADDEADDDVPGRVRRRPRRVTVLATVAAVLAAVFCVIAFVVNQRADDTRASSPAAARDAALLAARQDIVVLNTLDYTDVDGGLQRWLAATTGTLRDQLSQVNQSDRDAIAASKSVTTASVLAAAVTQVDATRGSATVLASVQTSVKPQTGDATTKRTRFSLTMTRVGDVWKLSGVQQIPVTLT